MREYKREKEEKMKIDEIDDKFTWNGTDITEVLTKASMSEFKIGEKVYWKAIWYEVKVKFFEIRKCSTILPIICDELKPIFGLHKLGTHWTEKNKKIFMLIKTMVNDNGEIIQDKTMSEYLKMDPGIGEELQSNGLFRKQMQEIFTFRDILGILKNTDSCISLRFRSNIYFPISSYEPKMDPAKIKSCLSDKIINTWFTDVSVIECLKSITHIHKYEDISTGVHTIRQKLHEVFTRIDKSYIHYSDFIIQKILQRLQHTFPQTLLSSEN